MVSTSRQEQELIDALDHARRCAGRVESRARLLGDEFGALQAKRLRENQRGEVSLATYLRNQRRAAAA